jgi:hypothetical protein
MPYQGEETYYGMVYFRMEKLRICDKFFAKVTLIRQVAAHCFALRPDIAVTSNHHLITTQSRSHRLL